MLYSEDDIRFVSETEDGDDVILTFEASENVINLLKERFGEFYEDEFSHYISDQLKELVNGKN